MGVDTPLGGILSLHNSNISNNSLSYPTPNWQDSACQCSLHSSNISMLHPPTLLIFPQLKLSHNFLLHKSHFIQPAFHPWGRFFLQFSFPSAFGGGYVSDATIHTHDTCMYIHDSNSGNLSSITQTPCAILQPTLSTLFCPGITLLIHLSS